MIKKYSFLSYFLPLFFGLFIFSGIIFYVFYLKVQKIESFIDDINSQIELSSEEKLNGYDTKEFSLEWLKKEEIEKVESLIQEEDWDTLSLKEIDEKLEKNGLSPIGDPHDVWYNISPEEVYAVVSEEQWDTLSFADIDIKLEKAGFPKAGDPLSPLYTLTPEEVQNKYGETGTITYIWEKQLLTLKEVTHFYDSYITFIGIIACLIFGLLGAYFFLLKAQRPLEEALQKQKRFVSDVSHEIRTPLALMRSDAEILLRTKIKDKEDIEAFASTLIKDIDTLNTLTSTLLSLTKIESKSTIQKEKIYLFSFFQTLEEKFLPLMQEKDITFKNTLPENLCFFSERWLLFQLFSILFENAIKYTEKKGTTLLISWNIKKKNIEISLQDEGVGIDTKHIPFIFDRFYRVSDDRNTPWFGIGLSLAQEIVKLLGGTIKIKSTLWVGTTIVLSLKYEK